VFTAVIASSRSSSGRPSTLISRSPVCRSHSVSFAMYWSRLIPGGFLAARMLQ
jgi:hypothetical protein